MSKAKSDYLFARSAESLIWSRMCIVSAGGGANNYISTGKVEGINNKKVMKRNAYGFRDEMYFI